MCPVHLPLPVGKGNGPFDDALIADGNVLIFKQAQNAKPHLLWAGTKTENTSNLSLSPIEVHNKFQNLKLCVCVCVHVEPIWLLLTTLLRGTPQIGVMAAYCSKSACLKARFGGAGRGGGGTSSLAVPTAGFIGSILVASPPDAWVSRDWDWDWKVEREGERGTESGMKGWKNDRIGRRQKKKKKARQRRLTIFFFSLLSLNVHPFISMMRGKQVKWQSCRPD